jgi:hypothetical protein
VTNVNEGIIFVNQSAEYDVAQYVRNLFPLFGAKESSVAASLYGSLGSPLDQVNAIMGECQPFFYETIICEPLTYAAATFICPTYLLLNAFHGKSYKVFTILSASAINLHVTGRIRDRSRLAW